MTNPTHRDAIADERDRTAAERQALAVQPTISPPANRPPITKPLEPVIQPADPLDRLSKEREGDVAATE